MRSLADCLTASNLTGIEQKALLADVETRFKGVTSITLQDRHEQEVTVVEKALKAAEKELANIEGQVEKITGVKIEKEVAKKVEVKPEPVKEVKEKIIPKKEVARESIGLAFITKQNKVRPFTEFKEIAKGKDKGKIRLTLTDGKRVIVDKDNVRQWPEKVSEAEALPAKKVRKASEPQTAARAMTFWAYVRALGGINQNDPGWRGEIEAISKGARWQPGVKNKRGRSMDELVATIQEQKDGWEFIKDGNDVLEALANNSIKPEIDVDKLAEEEYVQYLEEGYGEDYTESEAFRADAKDIASNYPPEGRSRAENQATTEVAEEDEYIDLEREAIQAEANGEFKNLDPSIFDFNPADFELKPTEPTPYERAAALEAEGVVKRPEKAKKKAVFPEEGIKTVPGKQGDMFAVEPQKDLFEEAPETKLSARTDDPVRLPDNIDDPGPVKDVRYELLDALKHMQALELKSSTYKQLPDDDIVTFYKNQNEEELDSLTEEILEVVGSHYEEWLKRHDTGEGWAEEVLDVSDERGLYANPSEAFTDRHVGVIKSGTAWSIDVEQEIVDKVQEEHGMPPIPDNVEGILKEIENEYGEDNEGSTVKELKEQIDEEKIDVWDLQEKLQELRNEDYQYADKVYAETGAELGEILNAHGWDSPVGQTILGVMETEGWEAWKANWGAELTEAEDRIGEQKKRLDSATTIPEKMIAIHTALNEQHVYGTMAEHMDLDTADLDELAHMGDNLDFKDMVTRGYQHLVGVQTKLAKAPEGYRMTAKEFARAKTTLVAFRGWLRHAGLSKEVMERIDTEIKPFISLSGRNFEKSMEEHGGQLGRILGATTINNIKALVELSSAQSATEMERTAYHEAFHVARHWILPKADTDAVLKHFEGNEEDAADAFRDFMFNRKAFNASKPHRALRQLFYRIKRALTIIRNGMRGRGFTRPEDFFAKIYLGLYRPHFAAAEGVTAVKLPTALQQLSEMAKTANFKEWFKGSKIVDEKGKPLVVYHGTLDVFDKFKDMPSVGKVKFGKNIFHFTNDPILASKYAEMREWESLPRNVMPVYLNLKNPLIKKFPESNPGTFADYLELIGKAKRLKHDGIIIKNVIDTPTAEYMKPVDVYIAFSSTQIKSTFNIGTWSPTEERISLTGLPVPPEVAEATKDLDVTYQGRWEAIKGNPYAFTDNVTGSSFAISDLKGLPAKLKEIHKKFEGEELPITMLSTKEESLDEWAARMGTEYGVGQAVINRPILKDTIKEAIAFEQFPAKTARAALTRHLNDAMYWVVDKNRPIATVQKYLSNVTDDVDVFLKETQRPKRTAAKAKTVWADEVKPLIEKMSEYKINVSDLEVYKHALHAHEANNALRRSNAKMQVEKIIKALESGKAKAIKKDVEGLEKPDEWFDALNNIIKRHGTEERLQNTLAKWKSFSEKPSGMTDKEADEILKQFKGDKKIEKLGKMLDSINDNSLALLFNSGALAVEEYEAILNKYEHYVPLYREGFDDRLFGATRGLQPSGRPIKIRGGSTRNVVNIVAHSIANYEKAINRAEKARSQRALRGLIEANPESETITIEHVKKSPAYDSHGNLRMYPDLFNVNDNEMRIMVEGKQYLVSVQRDNKDAMLMMRTLKAEDGMTGPIVNTLAKLNRFLAKINTTWSPEFIISNFARDFQTAGINIQDTGVKGKGMLKGAKDAWGAIFAIERGKPKGTELEGYYERFKAAGGKIGWSDVHGSVESLGKKITNELKMMNGKRPVRKRIKQWLQMIEDINTSIENGIRLHVFKLAVDQGKTDEKAAQIASDLTVDFTKKGAAGPVINSLYLFANAGIQGSYRIFRAGAKSSKVRKTMAGIIGVGFAVGILNALAGGEDEDGEDYFNKIDDYIRERNMIIMLPGTKGKYVKIPLPWGYNVFWNIGSETSRAFTQENFDYLASAGRLASTFADAFNPVAAGTLLQTLSPTVADPFVQVAENKNWFGGDLMPERNKFDKTPDPDSQRYWKSVGIVSKWVTSQLNSLTGGDEIKPGMIDISPESLDLIVDTFGGSAFRFVKDTLGMPIKAVRREEIEAHRIPFARRVYGEKPEWADSRIFYANIEDVLIAKERLKAYKGTGNYGKLFVALKRERSLIPLANDSEKRLRRLRKRLKSATVREDKAGAERITERIKAIYIRFNKKYNETMGQKDKSPEVADKLRREVR